MLEGMGRSDEELVGACLAGDDSAFGILVGRWERKIHGAIYRVLGSDEEARDLVQEAFFRAYRGLPGFKREARFSSWLYQIATNLCRDRMRRRRGRTLVSLDEVDEAARPLAPAGLGALELVEVRDLCRAVAAAIADLPEEQREVIVLKEYQDLTFGEIAEIMDVPISTIKTRLYRGLGQLREKLARQGVRGRVPVPAPSA
jgi:RNA polymerase sigma-70 factor (ECF subfamily)